MSRQSASLVTNPAWTTGVIARAFETIEDAVPPNLLPRLTDVVPYKGAISAQAHEYGCGAYGCVFPTLDPGWVMKITTDDTEAMFAAKVANDLSWPICVKYGKVIRLAEEHKDMTVFLVWRESANEVGRIVEVLDDKYGSARGDHAQHMLNAQHEAAQTAFRRIHKLMTSKGRLRSGVSSGDLAMLKRLADQWRDTWQDILDDEDLTDWHDLATGVISVYDRDHVFFGDLHQGNFGLVTRNDGEHWVITDPGHVAVLDI